jgi:DNA-binding transcriptional regulator YhcF (GntR family)
VLPVVWQSDLVTSRLVNFAIDVDAVEPPFAQLRRQVVDGAREGTLAAGTRLPTVRALADELGLAPNTVAKAYRELEAAGVIETRGRSGSFVALSRDAGEQALQQAAASYAARARSLGVNTEAALRYVTAALDG